MNEINMENRTSKKIIFIIFLINILFFNSNLKSFENKIIYKIENQILTSIDLKNEINYLTALNPNLKKLNKNEIIEISKKSLVKDKIKEIEIIKNFKNPIVPEDLLMQLIKNIYNKIGFTELEVFKQYLQLNQVSYDNVLNKIQNEALWNELIIAKFSNKIKIDTEQLRRNIKKNTKSYLLSEILFEVQPNQNLEQKFKEISQTINDKGFGNAALKYSISETANIGGKLDWINEKSLNNNINNILNSLEKNKFTKPITVPGGFLILQVNNIKTTQLKNNIDKELKKIIRESKNYQYNQFSKLYFNRIKKDMEINEI
ncbi:peptidylprolyl isomerase [Candidatus Pelagibacter sp.]|uniref:peptidylprolyl isomerase n=1 Tax=Candidatus Pelagibacter sp. TaxID=2024849 RepID=UPI003D0C048E